LYCGHHSGLLIHSALNDLTNSKDEHYFTTSTWREPCDIEAGKRGKSLKKENYDTKFNIEQTWNGQTSTYSREFMFVGTGLSPDNEFCEKAKAFWTPQTLGLLTDGYCGSSCAAFSHSIQSKYARIIGLGGNPGSPIKPYDYGGASVNIWSTVITPPAFPLSDAAWPGQFPKSSDYGYPNILNFAKRVNGDIWLEWYYEPVDFKIDYWNFEDLNTIYESAATFLTEDVCASWEVLVSEDCESEVNNGLAGHPCVAGTFDRASCVESQFCEGNYYRLENGDCLKRPSCLARKVKIGLIAGLLVAAVAIGAGVAIAVFLIRKRK